MQIEISPGEAIDRLTILEIKLERIGDPQKRDFVAREYALLSAVFAGEAASGSDALRAELKAVNIALWDVEEALRQHEARADFGPAFIALARSVYRHNDRRAALKQQINGLCGSPLNDVKSYPDYSTAR